MKVVYGCLRLMLIVISDRVVSERGKTMREGRLEKVDSWVRESEK